MADLNFCCSFSKNKIIYSKKLAQDPRGVLILWLVDPVIVNNCYAMKFFTTIILLLLFSVTAFSQVKQKFKIADLEFMAGNWKTTSDWGDMDEVVEQPQGKLHDVYVSMC